MSPVLVSCCSESCCMLCAGQAQLWDRERERGGKREREGGREREREREGKGEGEGEGEGERERERERETLFLSDGESVSFQSSPLTLCPR